MTCTHRMHLGLFYIAQLGSLFQIRFKRLCYFVKYVRFLLQNNARKQQRNNAIHNNKLYLILIGNRFYFILIRYIYLPTIIL